MTTTQYHHNSDPNSINTQQHRFVTPLHPPRLVRPRSFKVLQTFPPTKRMKKKNKKKKRRKKKKTTTYKKVFYRPLVTLSGPPASATAATGRTSVISAPKRVRTSSKPRASHRPTPKRRLSNRRKRRKPKK